MLTTNAGSNFSVKPGYIQAYPAGSIKIWRGALVVLRLTDNLLYPAVNDPTDVYKQIVRGYAMEASTTGSTVRLRGDGKLLMKFMGANIAGSLGKIVCVYDDETCQLWSASGCKVAIGRVDQIVGYDSVYVNLMDRPARLATSIYD